MLNKWVALVEHFVTHAFHFKKTLALIDEDESDRVLQRMNILWLTHYLYKANIFISIDYIIAIVGKPTNYGTTGPKDTYKNEESKWLLEDDDIFYDERKRLPKENK